MRIKSDAQQTSTLSVILIVIGCLLIYLVNRRVEPRPGEHWIYIGGIFLITLGTYVFFLSEKMTITINKTKKGLQVRRQNVFHKISEFIPFANVQSVHVVRVGRRAGLKTYHLVIRLNQGKKLTPGRWSHNPAEINAVAQELAQEIGCEIKDAPVYAMPDLKSGILAGIGAIILYSIWYRLTVGKVCLAMWHGSAPAIIIPFCFIVLLLFFRPRIN